tara:strand:+ start:55 stop:699 length:645 start_codon:yes stop_codon:yes gene_type:complete
MIFVNAEKAFIYLYNKISNDGINYAGTKAVFNLGFELKYPKRNNIKVPWRKWNKDYAEYEWQWYLSANRNAEEIGKRAPIWLKCMDKNKEVNSNYGWHWQQNDQIGYVINELKKNKESRRASISIYDAKQRHNFDNDTPCTYAIHFYIVDNKLNMSVMMRSNDLWYGFCNDQYCFSKLQIMVAEELNINIGKYYHFVNNMHIYNNFLKKNYERI